MHLNDPKYIAWDQYDTISKSLLDETNLQNAIQLFKTAKVKILITMDYIPFLVSGKA